MAAALNLTSVALFTRLAGPAGYGEYLIAFSWAYVVYGWSTQWLQLAFFAHYSQDEAARQVPTLYGMLAGLLLVLCLAAALASIAGLLSWSLALKVVSLVLGLSVYDAATQIGEAKLSAGRVSLTIALRGLLVLLAGAFALSGFKTALALTLAVEAAHLLAVLPLLPDLGRAWSRATAWRYASYGWPLMASFGTASLGQNIDRLLLAGRNGTSMVGPYGAIGDLIRQSMVFISEAIAIAYIPLAKDAAARDDMPAAEGYLVQAFRAFVAVALFGGMFLLCFAQRQVAIILGPDFSAPTGPLIPWLALAAGLTIFRSYYLGQVIYFTGRSGLELVASISTVAITALLGVILIPANGAVGAAIALASGQAAACAVFLLGANGSSVLPLPWRDFLGIAAWAAGGYAAALAITHAAGDEPIGIALQLIAIGLSFVAAVRVYNIMNLNDILSEFASLAGNLGFAEPGDGSATVQGKSRPADGR